MWEVETIPVKEGDDLLIKRVVDVPVEDDLLIKRVVDVADDMTDELDKLSDGRRGTLEGLNVMESFLSASDEYILMEFL